MNMHAFCEEKFRAYEAAQWVDSQNHLLRNKGQRNTTRYHPKQIINVDLGCDTYGQEFGYTHPCVVLYNERAKVFIVPCSSQPPRRNKHGEVFPEFLEGTPADGFQRLTTLKLNEAKFVDKARIFGVLGRVTDPFFDVLYDRLFGFLFESKSYSLAKLQEERDRLADSVAHLTGELEVLSGTKQIASSDGQKEQDDL